MAQEGGPGAGRSPRDPVKIQGIHDTPTVRLPFAERCCLSLQHGPLDGVNAPSGTGCWLVLALECSTSKASKKAGVLFPANDGSRPPGPRVPPDAGPRAVLDIHSIYNDAKVIGW
jgi:hypothetical protein